MTDEQLPNVPDPRAQSSRRGPRREASMTLRSGAGAGDTDTRLDLAHQSAAEALHISYRLLMAGIGVLVVLFLLSGLKTVEEGKVGIRLFAGRITGRNLEPGMRWSAPQPLGEILTFHRNPPNVEIRDAFYPQRGRDPSEPLERIARTAGSSLDPKVDGMLITGDLNLAHAQWVVQYTREDVDEFAEKVHPDAEEDIVRMAVQRGAVHAVAQASLDDVIKPAGQSDVLISERARIYAQQMLDDLGSGLRIQALDVQRATVPFGIFQSWAELAGKDAEASQKIDEARSRAQQLRNEVAGAAAGPLIDLIGRYEHAVELGRTDEQEALLGRIFDLLEGEPVEIEGRAVTARVSGRVTRIINEARQYRSTVASRERARLSKFRSILEQFKTNPTVVVHREWADAYRAFRSRDFVQLMQVPPGVTTDLRLSEDPEIVRAQRTARRRQENLEAQQERRDRVERERFRPRQVEIYEADPGGG